MLTLSPSFYVILAFIFLAFAIALVIISTRLNYYRQDFTTPSKRKSTKTNTYWKVVKGKITKSKLEYRDVKRFGRKPLRQYRAHLGYEYYATDKKYENPELLQNWTNSKKDAVRYVNGLPEGSEVVVRFDPDDPENSTMELKPRNPRIIPNKD